MTTEYVSNFPAPYVERLARPCFALQVMCAVTKLYYINVYVLW